MTTPIVNDVSDIKRRLDELQSEKLKKVNEPAPEFNTAEGWNDWPQPEPTEYCGLNSVQRPPSGQKYIYANGREWVVEEATD